MTLNNENKELKQKKRPGKQLLQNKEKSGSFDTMPRFNSFFGTKQKE